MAPEWWYFVSGLFYTLGIIAFVAVVVAAVYAIGLIRNINEQVRLARSKVEGISRTVEKISGNAQEVGTNLAERTQSILGTIDVTLKGAAKKVEAIMAVLLAVGAAIALARVIKQRRQGDEQD